MPAMFMLRETIRGWTFRCTMSDLATAEALVATYSYSPRSKWIWAELIGFKHLGNALFQAATCAVYSVRPVGVLGW